MRDSLIERTNALQETNRELAATVETLNRAQEDLVTQEKLAALGSLVAGIAHELNTPIGNAMMAASSMSDFAAAFADDSMHGISRAALQAHSDNMREGGQILMRNLARAADLISSFKQVAVDRTTSRGRRFKLAEAMNEIVLTLQPRIKKTPYRIQLEIPDDIVMDSYPGPLGQVVTNLINNALLHGFDQREHGTVTIAARALPERQVEIRVHDDGMGIEPENLKRIYDPFFTTKLGAGGSGLGLHITHNIVTGILAGKIKVTSEPGRGTTFILTLPLVAGNFTELPDQ
jgi:signal transduction histidine kinase